MSPSPAQSILEYWYTIEFLTQSSYPKGKIRRFDSGAVRRSLSDGQERRKGADNQNQPSAGSRAKRMSVLLEVSPQDNLIEVLRAEAARAGLPLWGEITVYLGWVQREGCIERIAAALPGKDREERPEKSRDRIVCASLQLTQAMQYSAHSLSLSPVLWAVRQAAKETEGSLAERLSKELHEKDVQELEKKFFPPEQSGEPEAERESGEGAALTTLQALGRQIEHTYLAEFSSPGEEALFAMPIVLSFRLFADEKERQKEEEKEYAGLSSGYFAEDLQELTSLAQEDLLPPHVERYIVSLCGREGEDKVDLIHPADRQKLLRQLQEILHVNHAPLGKWPSAYMPVLMQQIAINLAIQKGETPLLSKNGPVFSVNGPPGTGKTTLLKEIIADHIVERAILLADYGNPEDAFTMHPFLHGDIPRKNSKTYDGYRRGWHTLKNDKINDFGILVTSSNNAAVENISKELPLGESMGDLYDPAKAQESAVYENGTETSPEIYFTRYAQKLLQNDKAWGMIAAALGKSANISSFYYTVLLPLFKDFYAPKGSTGAEQRRRHQARYAQVRAAFLEQVKKVREMQARLAALCDAAQRQEMLREEVGEFSIEAAKRAEADKRAEYNALLEETDCVKRGIAERERRLEQLTGEWAALEEEQERIRASVGREPRLLLWKKKAYRERAQRAQQEIEVCRERQAGLRELQNEANRALREWEERERALASHKRSVQEALMSLEKRREKCEELRRTELLYQRLKRESRMTGGAQTECAPEQKAAAEGFVCLDAQYVERLFSQEDKTATEAQTENPWFTAAYNREREKLFYLAMKLQREFILSSKACNDNLILLSQYWGLNRKEDGARIVFRGEDKQACSALYQTLLLFVPVISTTFASVGRFLKDVSCGTLGTLIVDEAGQAQPQMAVGALYRCRRAVIVGDPKQVEPVVTDDLKLLKQAVGEEENLAPYALSKTVSVQNCADAMNAFGTFLSDVSQPDCPAWVGSPLLVHRRCLSPMYDISNDISYNGIMRQKTQPPGEEKERLFLAESSRWIQVAGKEKGAKNHFVETAGERVLRMIEEAFRRHENPSLYVISPFTSVAEGMRRYLEQERNKRPESPLHGNKTAEEWSKANIGTVHTFQGKEADEVIFLLGCDNSKEAAGAVRWVNSNIVNVAATRAKYRLYIVGDAAVWRQNIYLRRAKAIMDTFAIRELQAIEQAEWKDEESKEAACQKALRGLPSMDSFSIERADENEEEYRFDAGAFAEELQDCSIFTKEFALKELQQFRFYKQEKLDAVEERVRQFLITGMHLYFLLKPAFQAAPQRNASCCAVLFCKALETQWKICFCDNLKRLFPTYKIAGGKKAGGSQEKDWTLGTFPVLLQAKAANLSESMKQAGKPDFNERWWRRLAGKMSECNKLRCKCCHSGVFTWSDCMQMLNRMFIDDSTEPWVAGTFFAGEVGKKLDG